MQSNCVNLLEGYSEDMDLKDIEALLYENYYKHKAQGYDVNSIFDQFIDNINKQETTNLDQTVSYTTFNNYDKISYLLASLGVKSDDYLSFIKEEVDKYDNIVPIDAQLYLARIGIAAINNPSLVSSVINRIKKKSDIKVPILDRLLFISGIGGSGKTSVVAKYITDYAKNKHIIVAGPTDTQVTGLNKSLGVTDGINAKQLLSLVIDDAKYKDLNGKFNNLSNTDSVESLISNADVKNHDSGILVIDEITHFSTLDLALINKWAKKNDIFILGLGDDTQSGYTTDKMIANIDTDNAFCLRTPRLAISLRNGNIQQSSDTKLLYGLTQQVRTLINDVMPKDKYVQARNAIKSYSPRYSYSSGELHGTIITDSFDQWDMIPQDTPKKIAYIGPNDITSKIPTAIKFNNIKELQGQEFDYLIYEGNIKAQTREYDDTAVGDLLNSSRELYTLISRGIKGAVIISPNSGFTSTEEFYTGDTTDFSQYANNRRNSLLEELNNYTFNPSTNTTSTSTNTNTNNSSSVETVTYYNMADLDDMVQDLDIIPTDKESLDKDNKQASNFTLESIESAPNENSFDRCYGNFSLLGLKRGAKKEWFFPDIESRELSDVGVIARFNNASQVISDGKEKDRLVRQLLTLKYALMQVRRTDNNERWSGRSFLDNHKDLQQYFNNSSETFENLKYYITLRKKKDTDTLVGFSDLNNDEVSFNYNGEQIVAVVEAKWQAIDPDNNIVTNTITLGSLPNPDINGAYSKYVEEHKELLPAYDNYVKQFKAIYDEGGQREINAPKNLITLLKHTNSQIPFQKVKPQQTWRWERTINGETFKGTTEGTLRDADTINKAALKDRGYLSVSEPIVYMGGANKLEGVNPKMEGQVVYLVSSLPNMSTEELVQMYCSNKLNTDSDNLDRMKVRMIVPTHRGLSFQDLTNQVWQDMYTLKATDTESANKYPQDQTQLGLRMYAHLWNTRANLKRVLSALQINPNDDLHIYNQFRRLNPEGLENKNLRYYIGWDEKARNDAFFKYTNGVYNWNDNAPVVETFRQEFIKEQRSLKESNPNKLKSYIYATPEYMRQMLKVVEGALAPFKDFINLKSLNDDGTTSEFDELNYITFDKEGRTNDIRKLFMHSLRDYQENNRRYQFAFPTYNADGNERTVLIELDQDVIKSQQQLAEAKNNQYKPWSIFKIVPMILTKNYRFVSMAMSPQGNKLWNKDSNKYKYKYTDSEGKSQIKVLPMQNLIKAGQDIGSITEFTNIIDLIFHGTTRVQDSKVFRESTAPFRWGIWAYPRVDYEQGSELLYKKSLADRGTAYFRKVRNTSGTNNINSLYMSDVIPIPLADISLEKRTDTTTKEQPTEAIISGDTEKINSIKNIGVITGSYSTIQEAITAHNLKLSTEDNTSLDSYSQTPPLIYLEDGNLKYIRYNPENIIQGFDFKSGETKNIFKDKRNPKNYYIINNDGIVEEYVLNSEDSNKKKKLIEEAIKNKEVLSKIYDEFLDIMDKWGYSETDIQEEYEVSRDKFMKSSSVEDMENTIGHVIEDTAADISQHENKYVDNIVNYDSCSINLI